MSLYVLLTTAGALGLLGGLHCIAMCTGLQRLAVHGAASGSPGPSGSGTSVTSGCPSVPTTTARMAQRVTRRR